MCYSLIWWTYFLIKSIVINQQYEMGFLFLFCAPNSIKFSHETQRCLILMKTFRMEKWVNGQCLLNLENSLQIQRWTQQGRGQGCCFGRHWPEGHVGCRKRALHPGGVFVGKLASLYQVPWSGRGWQQQRLGSAHDQRWGMLFIHWGMWSVLNKSLLTCKKLQLPHNSKARAGLGVCQH